MRKIKDSMGVWMKKSLYIGEKVKNVGGPGDAKAIS